MKAIMTAPAYGVRPGGVMAAAGGGVMPQQQLGGMQQQPGMQQQQKPDMRSMQPNMPGAIVQQQQFMPQGPQVGCNS